MNEKAKVAVAIMLSVIVVYIVWMLAFPGKPIENENNIESGEIVTNDEELLYTINRVSDTQLDLVTANEYTKTTTQYFFENDAVSNVIIIEEILSGDFAEAVYNGIQADKDVSQIYSDIKLEGNVITMILKQDYVNIYEGLNYEELFEELSNSLKISAE